MTLGDRLNQIIKEQGISKAEFARRIGVSTNYVYILTGNKGKEKYITGSHYDFRVYTKLILR